jgi:ribosomal protein L11 methyltransferase
VNLQARYTLTTQEMPLEQAQIIADTCEESFTIDALAVTLTETNEDAALWVTVAYFAERHEAEEALAELNIIATIEDIPDENWVQKSLQGLTPVIAGRFFLHGSHDRGNRRSGGVAIEIDAGTAFGTGHHGTTTGCLLALDKILKRKNPLRIFDLGCGTGVLAIAAAKVTHTKVLATDIDPEAVRVSIFNSRQNQLSPALQCHTAPGLHHPKIRNRAPFDLIFANILARPLAALAHGISQLLCPGGQVILSGLTFDQERWIKACYRNNGLVFERSYRLGNWIALVMKKPGAKRINKIDHAPTRAPGWELDL